MADERVVNYIMECLNRGYDAGYVIETLTEQGWTRQEINDAIDAAMGSRQYHDIPAPQAQPETSQTQQPAESRAAQPLPQQKPPRPLGVAIISTLGFISSAFLIISGIFVLSLSIFLETLTIMASGDFEAALGVLPSLDMIALLLFVSGIIGLVAFYMLAKRKRKGFLLVTIMMVLQTALGGITLNLPVVILSVIILVYILVKRNIFVY